MIMSGYDFLKSQVFKLLTVAIPGAVFRRFDSAAITYVVRSTIGFLSDSYSICLLVVWSCRGAFIIHSCVGCVCAALTKEDSIPEHDPEVSTSYFVLHQVMLWVSDWVGRVLRPFALHIIGHFGHSLFSCIDTDNSKRSRWNV